MHRGKIDEWACQSSNKEILHSFSIPKTPTQVKNKLGIKKFNLKPFLSRELIKCLTPEARKGRLYVLTSKAEKILKIKNSFQKFEDNSYLIGKINASPKQRYVVFKTLTLNTLKLTSEAIREKANIFNPCLSRISTKAALKDLVDINLVDTEMGSDGKRYYWIKLKGKLIAKHLFPTH